MQNTINKADLKGRPFNGKPHLKLKRIRTEPRQRIRQLLRSFLPLNTPPEQPENESQVQS
jgi:hypothetical protein